MSARKDYPYPEDEFDIAGSAGGPQGVHRAERSTARKLAPWIVVLLVVPLIAFGLVYYLSQYDSNFGDTFFNDDEPPAPTEPADDGESEDGADADAEGEEGAGEDGAAEAGEDRTAEDDEGDEEDPEADEPPAPPVNRQASVRVLNATSISGLAAIGAERVQADGFGSVVADNYRGGGARDASVVKYGDEELKPTADQVAQVLGISDVEQDPEAADGIIVELWQGLN